MRVLGIDHGDKRVGLAVTDLLRITAQAIGFYELKNKKEDLGYFKSLVAEYQIKEIVVGLPLMMDGTKGTQAQKAEEFGEWLRRSLDLPVAFWDERLTTRQAFSILREQNIKHKAGKKYKDQLSASIMLSSYLEHKRSESHEA